MPLSFTIIIGMMIVNTFYAALQMKAKSDLMVETVKQQNLNTELLGKMSNTVLKRSMIILEMLQTDDAFKNDELFTEMNALGTEFILAKSKFGNQNLEVRLQKLLDTQNHLLEINGPMLARVYELLQWEDFEKAKSVFVNVTLPRQKINLNLINEMSNNQIWISQDSIEQLQQENKQALTTIIVFGGISILLSIILTLFILRKQRITDKKLAYQASTDVLTDLPNRANFTSNINKYIGSKPEHTFAIVFFDIDYFKSINDNYGHKAGDEVLKHFSAKIQSYLMPEDILSRFGGDEFVLLLRSIRTVSEAHEFVDALSSRLDTSFNIENKEIFVSSSIGASLFSQRCDFESGCVCEDAADLLKHADIAMYTAKESGRNCFCFFSKEASEKMEKEHVISHALHTLLRNKNKNNELYLAYQPLMDIRNESIAECEALIRWRSSDGRMISPDEFVPMAEKSNLIEKINLFVIDEACKQQNEWHKSGITDIRININLSGNKVIFSNLLKRFEEHMKHYKLEPKDFGIELTERTLFEISKKTISQLETLRDKGMNISIDDFGTEYSSLMYLKKLPITTLKIDKMFIAEITNNKDDQALVNTIINLGHSLNLHVVAEGVETYEQFQYLKDHACNIAQGFYLHKPMNSKDIEDLKQVA